MLNIKLNKQNNTLFLLSILLLLTVFFRSPTLFNDYYDVDELSAIVQTHEYLDGRTPGVDFKESKLPVYHAIFKFSYKISPEYGWVIVHLLTILIIFLTSWFIFLIGKKLKNTEAGFIGAILYSVLISSFNRHFMATNGEIIYNLPVTAGLYLLLLIISTKNINKKILYCLLLLITMIIASQIKFHGVILFIFCFIFSTMYIPFYKNIISKKYIIILLSSFVFILFLLLLDYLTIDLITTVFIIKFYSKIFYATADKGLNPFYFLIKFIHHQGLLYLWHFIAWFPATVFIYRTLIKNKGKAETIQLGALALFFILTYLMLFGGGARLYYHYFMAAYPGLCIISGISLITIENKNILFLKKHFIKFLLVPALFFFSWNTKDVIIKHFYPQAFHNEGKILFWARAGVMGTWDDYLLPHKSYLDTVKYIKKNTKQTDRIFVWGSGAYLYYFSNRKMAIYHLWPKNAAIKIHSYYKENTKESIKKAILKEEKYVEQLRTNKPVLFIDTSPSGFAHFNLKVPRLIKKYLDKHYTYKTEINKMKIYRLKNK